MDLRITKTKKALYEALETLMKEKEFEEIKVSDICELALVNRSTFYSHYKDKYELIMDFIKSLSDLLKAELKKNTHITNSKEYYLELLQIFLDHVEEKQEAYAAVIINNKNSIIMDMIYSSLEEEIKANIESNTDIPSDIVSKFYLGGAFTLGMEWILNKGTYSKEDLVKYLEHLIPDNI